ncbi:DUF3375 family protein [Natronosporangium hydrolyticum]|uniref:DUF3375 family protein n=1 Tax=Natronosporangium hydrolyticum TaxID=2811111 RepID=A0A895YPN8_9ACTN|nr:DUF3375 family protein [Natronosporangium hydrolyticum]QSB16696.1 DUF3375 family protein [Natronosporangium hydrolyticum]
MTLQYEEIAALRKHSPAWRLLCADNAPLVLSFLHRVFVEGNARSVTATELTPRSGWSTTRQRATARGCMA